MWLAKRLWLKFVRAKVLVWRFVKWSDWLVGLTGKGPCIRLTERRLAPLTWLKPDTPRPNWLAPTLTTPLRTAAFR